MNRIQEALLSIESIDDFLNKRIVPTTNKDGGVELTTWGRVSALVNSQDARIEKLEAERDELVSVLSEVFMDLETGFISNQGYRAQQNRNRHEAKIRDLLAKLKGAK